MNVKNIVHALQSEFGFKPKPGGGLTGGRCLACGEPEAYTPPTNPHIILCPRANQCGVRTLTKSVLPSLYQVRKSHPPTATNPMATAKAYLQTRGLSTQGISKTTLWQGSYTLRLNGRNHDWPTVAFMLENGSICHRLIDWTGKGKTRMQGRFQGLVWLPKPLHIEPPPRQTTLWLVEGCMDALSLTQVGLNAAAITAKSSAGFMSAGQTAFALKGFFNNQPSSPHSAKPSRVMSATPPPAVGGGGSC